jgi:hypothetical protein
MPTDLKLPGVSDDSCPPRVVCDAHAAIRSARRRAVIRQVGQVVILAGVDWLFYRWPEARIPFAGRGESLFILRTANALAIGELWLTRALPRWNAQRIASTWSRSEREKFQKPAARVS